MVRCHPSGDLSPVARNTCDCSPLQEVTEAHEAAEVAFTGDTTIDWVREPSAAAALRAKLLIMEVTFVDDAVSPAAAQEK